MNYGKCHYCKQHATTPVFTAPLRSIKAQPKWSGMNGATVQPKWVCDVHVGYRVDAYTGDKPVPWAKSYIITNGKLKPLPKQEQYDVYQARKEVKHG